MSLDLKSNVHQNNLKAVKPSDSHIYEFENFRLDAAHLMLYRDAEEISLPPKQVETLLALIERSGEIVSKDDLMNRLWANAFVEESNLIQNIYILRKILGETATGKPMIETLRRRGYRFNAELKTNVDQKDDIAPEPPTEESAVLLKFPSVIIEKTSAETSGVDKFSFKKRTLAAIASALFLVAAVGLGLYYFAADKTIAGDRKTIAVLPLKPINAANRDEIYEFGIADSLIHRLGTMKGFFVRPLSATRKYADIEQDAIAAGKEQKVDYVLAANYQLANGRIRVTAQLFNVASGQIEETKIIEKDAGDIFAAQDAIAGEVGNMLQARFAATSTIPKAVRGTSNEEAYRLFLQGKNLTMKRNPADHKKAVEYFEQAIRLDPNYALAYARMAHAYFFSGLGDNIFTRTAKAKELLKKALELDNNLAEAYVIRGEINMIYEYDFPAAETDYRRAIELEPNNDFAHWLYALLLNNNRRFDEAMTEIETAQAIDPGALLYMRDRGRILYFAHRFDEAIAQLNRVIDLDENFATSYIWLWNAYDLNGDYAAAYRAFISRLKKTNPDRIETFQKIYETGGWLAVRQKMLEFSRQIENMPEDDMYFIKARQSALSGEKDQAFAHLNKAFEQRDWRISTLNVEPSLDSLRDDPRFDELVRRVGLK